MSHFPDNIVTALKDAVINVFWQKKDVRSLFCRCNVPPNLISLQNWDDYKIKFVSPIIDALNSDTKGLGPLRQILNETLQYNDGKHLLWMKDGEKRRKEAERSLEHLRLLVKDHDLTIRTQVEEREARIRRQAESRSLSQT